MHSHRKISRIILLSVIVASVVLAQLSLEQMKSRRLCLDADELFSEGTSYAKNKKYHKAIDKFTKTIRLCPEYALAYFKRAMAYDALQFYKNASSDYTKTIKINPRHYKAFNKRGVTYHKIGKIDQAIRDYSESIKIFPRYCTALKNRSIAFCKKKMIKEAFLDLDRVASIDPSDDDIKLLRAKTHIDAGNFLRAVTDFNRIIEMNPDNIESWIEPGDVMFKIGMLNQHIYE